MWVYPSLNRSSTCATFESFINYLLCNRGVRLEIRTEVLMKAKPYITDVVSTRVKRNNLVFYEDVPGHLGIRATFNETVKAINLFSVRPEGNGRLVVDVPISKYKLPILRKIASIMEEAIAECNKEAEEIRKCVIASAEKLELYDYIAGVSMHDEDSRLEIHFKALESKPTSTLYLNEGVSADDAAIIIRPFTLSIPVEEDGSFRWGISSDHYIKGYWEHCIHPHTHENGACWGEMGGAIEQATTEKDIVSFVEALYAHLLWYNPEDEAGKHYRLWRNAKGFDWEDICKPLSVCWACGNDVEEDDLTGAFVENDSKFVCNTCIDNEFVWSEPEERYLHVDDVVEIDRVFVSRDNDDVVWVYDNPYFVDSDDIVYSDYKREYFLADEAVYIDSVDSWVHESDTIYIEYKDDYVLVSDAEQIFIASSGQFSDLEDNLENALHGFEYVDVDDILKIGSDNEELNEYINNDCVLPDIPEVTEVIDEYINQLEEVKDED